MTPLSRPTRLRTKDRDIEGLHLSLSGRPFRVNRRHTLLRFSALATTDQATPIQEARQHHFDRTILAVGVFIVFWKMHGLKLPSEIAAEHIRSLNDLRAQSKQPLLPQVRVRLWTSIADWMRPWRWGRGDLLKSSTPTGGDFGAHVWLPDFVRRSLLPKGRLTGWSNDFFGGFPALGFYFPLPALSIAFLSFVVPYGIAFKLISVAGICSLPFAAHFMGRASGLRRPVPLFMGLSTFVFLLGRFYDLFIYGGGILPTMAGEFSFSIGLTFAVLFLGSFNRLLRTGIGLRRTSLLLTCTGLSHLLPTLWALSVAGTLVIAHLLAYPNRRVRLKRAGFTFGVGGMLAGWWIVPFAFNLSYSNDMGWEKSTHYVDFLFPFMAKKRPGDSHLIAVALALCIFGFAKAVFEVWRARSKRMKRTECEPGSKPVSPGPVPSDVFIVVLGVVMILCGLLLRFSPQYRLWNARILPFWFLSMLLIGGYGAASIPRVALRSKVRIASVGILFGVGLPLQLLPGWMPVPRLSHGLVGFQQARRSADRNDMTSWTKHNFAGYEAQSGWSEYHALMNEAGRVGRESGCGRAMWEHEEVRFATYGTTLSLMLLPYWTKGCIGSIDGIYFESSATLPQHWIMAGLVSAPRKDNGEGGAVHSGPTNPQRDLPYKDFDLEKGLGLMRRVGVRYFIAVTDETKRLANTMPVSLSPVGSSGPYLIYRIVGSELVRPLTEEPVVVRGIGQSQNEGWLDVGMAALGAPDQFPKTMVASGPTLWQRAIATVKHPPGVRTYGAGTSIPLTQPRALPNVTISNIQQTNVDITFDVDRVGVPVELATSFFPNWHASGATGPYRSVPNYMVVIPTKHHVHIRYGYSNPDKAGSVGTFLGVLCLALPTIRSIRKPRTRLKTQD